MLFCFLLKHDRHVNSAWQRVCLRPCAYLDFSGASRSSSCLPRRTKSRSLMISNCVRNDLYCDDMSNLALECGLTAWHHGRGYQSRRTRSERVSHSAERVPTILSHRSRIRDCHDDVDRNTVWTIGHSESRAGDARRKRVTVPIMLNRGTSRTAVALLLFMSMSIGTGALQLATVTAKLRALDELTNHGHGHSDELELQTSMDATAPEMSTDVKAEDQTHLTGPATVTCSVCISGSTGPCYEASANHNVYVTCTDYNVVVDDTGGVSRSGYSMYCLDTGDFRRVPSCIDVDAYCGSFSTCSTCAGTSTTNSGVCAWCSANDRCIGARLNKQLQLVSSRVLL